MCKFYIRQIFGHLVHKNLISCTKTLRLTRTIYSCTHYCMARHKPVDLSLIHTLRSVIFPCGVPFKTKLMSGIRESVRTFREKSFVEYIAMLFKHRTLPASRTTSHRKDRWFKERTVNVYHVLTIKYCCAQKLAEKQLHIVRLQGYAVFRVRKYHC